LGLISVRGRDFSLCYYIQIGSGANLVSSTMGAGALSLGYEVDHSPPSSTQAKIYGPIHPYGGVLNFHCTELGALKARLASGFYLWAVKW
jgi:hypothetical protein